ncbi:MAG: NAD(P)/FAD-dependent oxidoreductase, partial [Desulfatiglandales bacterium]
KENSFLVKTQDGESFTSRVLINSSGLYSDQICRLLGITEYKIYPCRGEYLILDKRLGHHLKTLVYPAPHHGKAGLGIHLTKTVDGNILIGPSNEYVNSPEDYATTREIMGVLLQEGKELLPDLETSDVIRSFCGLRAKQTPPEVGGFKDFVIEHRKDLKGFINLLGIESPGLTSAPAIALTVRDLVKEVLTLEERRGFSAELPGFVGYFHELPYEERMDLISKEKDYGEIVCRCEGITKKELIDAIENPLGVKTLSALRYRARVMMGRCQGGFCLPRIVEILTGDFGLRPEEFILHRRGSHLFTGNVR